MGSSDVTHPELERACEIVAEKDVQPLRRALFRRLAEQRPTVRAALATWDRLGKGSSRAAFVAAYAAKSFLDPRLPDRECDIVAAWQYANERRQVETLARLVPELRLACVTLGPTALLSLTRWRELVAPPRAGHGAWTLLERFARRGDFLVAARVAGTIGHYLRMRSFLEQSPARAVLVSSDANPFPLALVCAARELGKKTCFVTHGHVADGPPPLDFDLSLLDGPAVREVYARAGPIRGRVAFKGSEGFVRRMDPSRVRRGVRTLGVFLSILVDWRRVSEVLARLRAELRPERVVLRLHPNREMRHSGWAGPLDLGGVRVSDGDRTLVADAEACDLVAAGNSSAHLSVLKLGVPTLYVPELDELEPDYYRFVAEGIVAPKPTGPLDLEQIATFYEGPGWMARFARFDAGYPDSQARCDNEVATELRRLVGRQGGAS